MKIWKRRIALLLLGMILVISGTGYFSGEPIDHVGHGSLNFVLAPQADTGTNQLILPEWDTEEETSRNADEVTLEATTEFKTIISKVGLNTFQRIRKGTCAKRPLYMVNRSFLI